MASKEEVVSWLYHARKSHEEETVDTEDSGHSLADALWALPHVRYPSDDETPVRHWAPEMCCAAISAEIVHEIGPGTARHCEVPVVWERANTQRDPLQKLLLKYMVANSRGKGLIFLSLVLPEGNSEPPLRVQPTCTKVLGLQADKQWQN